MKLYNNFFHIQFQRHIGTDNQRHDQQYYAVKFLHSIYKNSNSKITSFCTNQQFSCGCHSHQQPNFCYYGKCYNICTISIVASFFFILPNCMASPIKHSPTKEILSKKKHRLSPYLCIKTALVFQSTPDILVWKPWVCFLPTLQKLGQHLNWR